MAQKEQKRIVKMLLRKVLKLISPTCSLTDVTSARRRSTLSSTSPSTSPHTQPPTSPARCAIKSSPALPASNLTSCCTKRRRSVNQPAVHQFVAFYSPLALTTVYIFCPHHLFSHSTLQNLICSECGDEFVLQSQLSLHLEEHRKELAGVRVYTCKTCDKEFKTSVHLKEHMKSHTKMRSAGITDPICFHLAESGGGWNGLKHLFDV